jgi:hypothetical protein
MNSNTIFNSENTAPRVIFVVAILILFVVLLRAGISILSALLIKPRNRLLINGMVDARHQRVIPQDPSTAGAMPLDRSVNERDGVEFTWSVWMFVDDLGYRAGRFRGVFYKGNSFSERDPSAPQGLNFPNNAPGLYISPDTNALTVVMNTFQIIGERIIVPDLPLNKWVNVTIRCSGEVIDIYMNGNIARSRRLSGVPKQNYGDVIIAPDGGFSGLISDLRYEPRALTAPEIEDLVNDGPNTKSIDKTGVDATKSDYLSSRWYSTDRLSSA